MTTAAMSTAPSLEPATSNLDPATLPPRRLKGKIAGLPKDHRDTINKLLLDGSTYVAVIARMAELGISLNPENVSNWYQTGFQEYLQRLETLEFQRARYEAASDLIQNIDISKIPEAGLQTAAAQIYDLLDRFTPADIAGSLADEPDRYIRMVNSLSRLTREALSIQKYSDGRARSAPRQLDPNRELDQTESRAIVRQVDRLFGLASGS
jgi:hypothetical protein